MISIHICAWWSPYINSFLFFPFNVFGDMNAYEWGYIMGMVGYTNEVWLGLPAASLKWLIYYQKSGDVTIKRRIPRNYITNHIQTGLSVYMIYVNFQCFSNHLDFGGILFLNKPSWHMDGDPPPNIWYHRNWLILSHLHFVILWPQSFAGFCGFN